MCTSVQCTALLIIISIVQLFYAPMLISYELLIYSCRNVLEKLITLNYDVISNYLILYDVIVDFPRYHLILILI